MGSGRRSWRGGSDGCRDFLPVRALSAPNGVESMTDRVAVVSAGQMGNGIAHVFAQSGIPVTMIDVSQAALDKGRATITKNLERQVKKGSIAADDQAKILSRIDLSANLDAVKEADLIVEAATEDSGL